MQPENESSARDPCRAFHKTIISGAYPRTREMPTFIPDSSTPTVTMAGVQAAKKELRRKMREVLRSIPKDSIVSQSGVATNKLLSLPEYRNAKRIGIYLSMPSGEVSTTSIVQSAFKEGKDVYIPYIHSAVPSLARQKNSIMDMLALRSLEEFESLEPDNWGIPSLKQSQVSSRKNCFGGYGVSPHEDGKAMNENHGLDLVIMPGMAFDRGFRRLGHGKGYYDHFLTRYSKNEVNSKTNTPKLPFLGERPSYSRTNKEETSLNKMHLVALSLKEQMLPASEEIPVWEHDWLVDAVIVGDGQFLVHERR